MGGGNAQKSAMSRAKNQAKAAAAGKGSQLEANKKALSIQCKICLAPFICTSSESKLKEHSDSKHPKETFARCFPDYTAAA